MMLTKWFGCFSRLFEQKLTLVEHRAIVKSDAQYLRNYYTAELAKLDRALDKCEAARLEVVEELHKAKEENASLAASNVNLSKNALYYQGDNTRLRANIANAEAALRTLH